MAGIDLIGQEFLEEEAFRAISEKFREAIPKCMQEGVALLGFSGGYVWNLNQIDGITAPTEAEYEEKEFNPLKAADAMQLAAALVATDENPLVMDFITLDARLKTCAANEGFQVLP